MQKSNEFETEQGRVTGGVGWRKGRGNDEIKISKAHDDFKHTKQWA